MSAAPLNDTQTRPQFDARKFERKRIPLSAILLDLKGTSLSNCTIVDLSLVGALINLPTTGAIPERVFVVELTNEVAYEAKVAWWRPSAAGLAFQEVYKLDEHLPKHLDFLKQALIEAKLQQIDALTANGASLTDALRTAGMPGTVYARWSGERFRDNNMAQRLCQVEAENAALRQLLLGMAGDSHQPPKEQPNTASARNQATR